MLLQQQENHTYKKNLAQNLILILEIKERILKLLTKKFQ
jgi:hypothetical protein